MANVKFEERLHNIIPEVVRRSNKLVDEHEGLSAGEILALRTLVNLCTNLLKMDEVTEEISVETLLSLKGGET